MDDKTKNRTAVKPISNWTHKSVLAFANNADPLQVMENAARNLVLRARERGWDGPPFNPLYIAEMLGAQVEANSSIADARLMSTDSGAKIEFNPKQPRERVRFSIAHEVAHLLFNDWSEQIRNREGDSQVADDWQLEMLCNLAASEFVMPTGSLASTIDIPTIEQLMVQRRRHDVSVEAFLIRLAKVSAKPVGVFFASPLIKDERRSYRIDYLVTSPTAPSVRASKLMVPARSVVQRCTAVGYSNSAVENWVIGKETMIECVGIPAYPGDTYPRVAGLVRFDQSREDRTPIKLVHGNVTDPIGDGPKIVCQLVNDRATKWGGGVARKSARKFPEAEIDFSEQLHKLPQKERLGNVIFSDADEDITIASLIAQEGFGASLFPRIRYSALEEGLEKVTKVANRIGASIHMPRIGTGAAGGNWNTIEELIDDAMVRSGLSVTIYDPPPKRAQLELF